MAQAQQHHNNNNGGNNSNSASSQQQQQLVKPVLHDFLGMKPSDVRLPEPSPSSSSGAGGGARGPFSTASDIASGESLPLQPPHLLSTLKMQSLLFLTFTFFFLGILSSHFSVIVIKTM